MSRARAPRTAVYAGTFDPITLGHIDIISRAIKIFDELYVAVAESTPKEVLFPLQERVTMVEHALKTLQAVEQEKVKTEGFSGLLVDYVHSRRAAAIVRGLRAVSDYEYEAQMALINRNLDPDLETVYFVTSPHCSFISSSVVKIIAKNGGDVSHLVPENVAERLKGLTAG